MSEQTQRQADERKRAERAIKDALWESSDTGFEGLPHDRADAIIRWFAAREVAASPRSMLAEFHAAVSHPDTDLLWLRRTLHDEEHDELVEALEAGDRAAIARELADVVYSAFGTAHAYGIDIDAALAEVHRANMQKANGPRRADGKAMKPEGFVPPDMTAAAGRRELEADLRSLRQQGHRRHSGARGVRRDA